MNNDLQQNWQTSIPFDWGWSGQAVAARYLSSAAAKTELTGRKNERGSGPSPGVELPEGPLPEVAAELFMVSFHWFVPSVADQSCRCPAGRRYTRDGGAYKSTSSARNLLGRSDQSLGRGASSMCPLRRRDRR